MQTQWDWSRTLRIVLKEEKTECVLNKKIPEKPSSVAPSKEVNAYKKHKDDDLDVQCLMLVNIDPTLQIQFEKVNLYDMYQKLKALFKKQDHSEKYDTLCALLNCKLTNGQAGSPHTIMMMMGLIDRMRALGSPMSKELATDAILRSLPTKFNNFVMYFNMHQLDKPLTELHGMTLNAEANLEKEKGTNSSVLVVHKKMKSKKRKRPTKGKANVPTKAMPLLLLRGYVIARVIEEELS